MCWKIWRNGFDEKRSARRRSFSFANLSRALAERHEMSILCGYNECRMAAPLFRFVELRGVGLSDMIGIDLCMKVLQEE